MVAGVHVKGNLTLAEDLADTGGLRLAWSALTRANGGSVDKQTAQLFFESFAQVPHTLAQMCFVMLLVLLMASAEFRPGVVFQNRRAVATPQRSHGPTCPFPRARQRWSFEYARIR
jgi:predicted metalloendopeptidase